mmetsp:Transcript_16013/g.40832  ORF Transcript_16013/g.40832 Transcript_16013/m.40832 type:complete len:323 (+) Transcript_16013:1649-2617(+)
MYSVLIRKLRTLCSSNSKWSTNASTRVLLGLPSSLAWSRMKAVSARRCATNSRSAPCSCSNASTCARGGRVCLGMSSRSCSTAADCTISFIMRTSMCHCRCSARIAVACSLRALATSQRTSSREGKPSADSSPCRLRISETVASKDTSLASTNSAASTSHLQKARTSSQCSRVLYPLRALTSLSTERRCSCRNRHAASSSLPPISKAVISVPGRGLVLDFLRRASSGASSFWLTRTVRPSSALTRKGSLRNDRSGSSAAAWAAWKRARSAAPTDLSKSGSSSSPITSPAGSAWPPTEVTTKWVRSGNFLRRSSGELMRQSTK